MFTIIKLVKLACVLGQLQLFFYLFISLTNVKIVANS